MMINDRLIVLVRSMFMVYDDYWNGDWYHWYHICM
jgi:hypothetical protein